MKNLLLFLLITMAGTTVRINAGEANQAEKLCQAAQQGDLAAVIRLLNDRADVNSRGNYGWTALALAIINNHLPIVELLIMRGADVELLIVHNAGVKNMYIAHATPLMGAAIADKENTEIAQLLLQNKANVNAVDPSNTTALMETAAQGRDNMVKLLLKHQADINVTNCNDRTTLYYSTFRNRSKVTELLINAGAKAEPQKSSKCILM